MEKKLLNILILISLLFVVVGCKLDNKNNSNEDKELELVLNTSKMENETEFNLDNDNIIVFDDKEEYEDFFIKKKDVFLKVESDSIEKWAVAKYENQEDEHISIFLIDQNESIYNYIDQIMSEVKRIYPEKVNLYKKNDLTNGIENDYKVIDSCVVVMKASDNELIYQTYYLCDKENNGIVNFYFLLKEINGVFSAEKNCLIEYSSSFEKSDNEHKVDLINPEPIIGSIMHTIPINDRYKDQLEKKYEINVEQSIYEDKIAWNVIKKDRFSAVEEFNWAQGIHIESDMDNYETTIKEKNKYLYNSNYKDEYSLKIVIINKQSKN